jgi:hypothetical protein
MQKKKKDTYNKYTYNVSTFKTLHLLLSLSGIT